jgi:hypothetical protein
MLNVMFCQKSKENIQERSGGMRREAPIISLEIGEVDARIRSLQEQLVELQKSRKVRVVNMLRESLATSI